MRESILPELRSESFTISTVRKKTFQNRFVSLLTRFPRHISYDVVLFGSWRRKGVWVGEKQIASPNAYPVAGFNFAPMYNLSYKLRVGASLRCL